MSMRSLSLKLALLPGCLFTCLLAQADECRFADGYTVQNVSATLSTSLSIPRDAPIGPIGNELLITNGSPSTKINCDWGPDNKTYYMDQLISPGSTTSTSSVYQTNVPGIGIKVRASSVFGTSTLYTVKSTLTSFGYVDKAESTSTTDNITAQLYKVYVQFYVTGPVTPGDIVFNSPMLRAAVGPNDMSENGILTYSNLIITNSIPVTVLACETPDITVDLKKHDSSDFPRIGATSAATSFNFAIKNCPANLNSVNYTFKPASGITLKGSGDDQYLTLDGDSTASGVGIQMLYGDGSSIPFNSKTEYTGYVASTGGDYTIPMKARYVRTGTISPGTANSAVEFEMSYE